MGRHIDAVCRLCRREGMKLFLKGTRCDTPKCGVERRESPPGMNTGRRGKLTDYGTHLREKQKVKRYYGVLERQFRKYFQQAERTKGHTGDALMTLLERRLDNIVCRLGLRLIAGPVADDDHPRPHHRQRPAGEHPQLPGSPRRRDPREEPSQEHAIGRGGPGGEQARRPRLPRRGGSAGLEGRVLRYPEAADVSLPVQTQLIVELCSK